MTIKDSYPNLTIEQICELSLYIDFSRYDSSMYLTFMDDELEDFYNYGLNRREIVSLQGLLAKILLLEEEITYYRETNLNFTQNDIENYVSDILRKINIFIGHKFSLNERVCPKDLLKSVGIMDRIGFNKGDEKFNLYHNLLNMYVNGLSIENGKELMPYSNNDKYIDKTPDYTSPYKAKLYIKDRYLKYLKDTNQDISRGVQIR